MLTSITYAYKARDYLAQKGISAYIERTPEELKKRGCSYSIAVRGNADAVAAMLEAAGIKDVRGKSIGSSNTVNMAYATLEGLKTLMTVEKVAKLRGKTPEEILG